MVPEEDRAVQECQHPELSHQVRLFRQGDIILNRKLGSFTHTLRRSYTKHGESSGARCKEFIRLSQAEKMRRKNVKEQRSRLKSVLFGPLKSEVT